MTKTDLVKAIAIRENLPTYLVERVVNAFLDTVGLALSAGEDVKLQNFGKFEVREHNPVTRRNPRTGEAIQVPAKTSCGFKPSPSLKDRVNGK